MLESHSNKALTTAFLLNLLFAIAELVGGFYTNSLAILSNGLHDVGDSISLGIAWIFDRLSKQERTHTFSYGYKRFSLVSALLNSIILLIGSFFILSEAIPRLSSPQHSNADGMFVFALVGVCINLVAYVRLKRGKTMNEQVSALHLLDDVLGLSSVLVISVIIKVFDIHILDPILSILITMYLLSKVLQNLKKTLSIFLQSVPENVDLPLIEKHVLTIPNVMKMHDTHVWSLDGESNVFTTHLVVPNDTSHEEMVRVKNQAKEYIQKQNVSHVTIEIGCEDEACLLDNC